MFRQGKEYSLAPGADHTEVADILRPLVFSQTPNQPVVQRIGKPESNRSLAPSPHAVAHVQIVTLGLLKKLDQHLNRILEIAVRHADVVALCKGDPHRES